MRLSDELELALENDIGHLHLARKSLPKAKAYPEKGKRRFSGAGSQQGGSMPTRDQQTRHQTLGGY